MKKEKEKEPRKTPRWERDSVFSSSFLKTEKMKKKMKRKK